MSSSACSWRSASWRWWCLPEWLIRRKRAGLVTLLDLDLFQASAPVHGQGLGSDAAAGDAGWGDDRPATVLPNDARVQRLQAGLSLTPLSLTMFAAALVVGRKAGDRRPAAIIRAGFLLASLGIAIIIPFVPRADSGWYFVLPLAIVGCGLGLLVSQLNNYTLAPIEEERVSEAAGVNSAAGSFGLSFGLAMAGGILLAALSLSFTQLVENSQVIPQAQQEQIAAALEDDAEVMSNTRSRSRSRPAPAVEAEVVAINNEARNLSLQIALLVPLPASSLLGLGNSFRMLRLPDQKPASSIDGMDFG